MVIAIKEEKFEEVENFRKGINAIMNMQVKSGALTRKEYFKTREKANKLIDRLTRIERFTRGY